MEAGVLESSWLAPVHHLAMLVGRTLASLAVTTIDDALILARPVLGYAGQPSVSSRHGFRLERAPGARQHAVEQDQAVEQETDRHI